MAFHNALAMPSIAVFRYCHRMLFCLNICHLLAIQQIRYYLS